MGLIEALEKQQQHDGDDGFVDDDVDDGDFADKRPGAGLADAYELKYKAPVKLVVDERAGVVEQRVDEGFAGNRGCDDWKDGWDF